MKKFVFLIVGLSLLAAACNSKTAVNIPNPTPPVTQNPTPSPTSNQPANSVPANWKTYTNTTYRYGLKYPSEIGYLNQENGVYVGPLTDAEAQKNGNLILGTKTAMIMQISASPSSTTFDAKVIENLNQLNDRKFWAAPIDFMLNGVTFKKYVVWHDVYNGNREFYVGTTNKVTYMIGITDIAVGKQILGTFKFTK
ncbi:MAG TPA: hypothetical protein VF974_05820 [Patescibacteria group bacterium]